MSVVLTIETPSNPTSLKRSAEHYRCWRACSTNYASMDPIPGSPSCAICDATDTTLGVGTADPYIVIIDATSSRAFELVSVDVRVAGVEVGVVVLEPCRFMLSKASVRFFRLRCSVVNRTGSGHDGKVSIWSKPITFPEGPRSRPSLSKTAARLGNTIKQCVAWLFTLGPTCSMCTLATFPELEGLHRCTYLRWSEVRPC